MTVKRDEWLIGAAALCVRLIYVVLAVSTTTLEPPSTLSSMNFLAGYGIAHGLGYTDTDRGTPARTYLAELARRIESGESTEAMGPMPRDGARPYTLHPPGLALLVAGAHAVTGGPAHLWVELLGAWVDSLAAVLLFWLVRALWDDRLARWSGYAYAFYLPLAYAATGAEAADGFCAVFVLGAALLIVHGIRATGRAAWLWYAAAGVVTGLGMLFRPDYLLLPLWMIPAVAWLSRRWRHAVAAMVVVQACVFVPLTPWALRNQQQIGRLLFTSTSAGTTLIGGLGEFNNPWGFGVEDAARFQLAQQQGIASPWTSEADLYFRKLYWQSVASHPGAALWAAVRRVPLGIASPQSFGYVNPNKTVQFSQIRATTGEDRYQYMFHHPWTVVERYWEMLLTALLSLVATVGGLLWFRSAGPRRDAVFFLWSAHGYAVCSHVVVHMEPRYLLPSIFPVLATLVWMALAWRDRRRGAQLPHAV